MSTHHDHQDPNNLKPEASGISARPILAFLVILTVSTAVVYLIVQGLLFGLSKVDQMNQDQPVTALPEGQKRKLPPEPRLQGAPGPNDLPSELPLDDNVKYKRSINERVEGYGWVNKDAGTVHIPVDRAKELIVERGLPEISGGLAEEIQRAETVRRRVLNATSSAGRMISDPQQAIAPNQPQQQAPSAEEHKPSPQHQQPAAEPKQPSQPQPPAERQQ